MAEKKAEPEQAEKAPTEEQVHVPLLEPSGGEAQSNWEFIDRIPSRMEVLDLLKTLPDWWGEHPVDYIDYVQGLPSTKKVKVKKGRVAVDEWHNVVTLYFGVAGRLQMLREAQETRGWRVDFVPEPVTPTGVPGYLQMNDRLVYREYVEIFAPIGARVKLESSLGPVEVVEWRSLGRRSGTAWVPAEGGKQAAGSNPYEKVETSARGRAIAAWGFGVLPGSGIASLEEMLGQQKAEPRQQPGAEPEQQVDKDALVQGVLARAEQIRQIRGQNEYESNAAVAAFAQSRLGVDVVKEKDEESGAIGLLDLTRLRPAQLLLMRNSMDKTLTELKSEGQEI